MQLSKQFFPVFLVLNLFGSPYSFATTNQDPESTTGITQKQQVQAKQYLVVSANPLATQAGVDMLAQGGSAIDAAIAVQLMLGLVEPQSSGIGGGLFLLHWDDKSAQLATLDGRETAPAAADPDWFVKDGALLNWSQAYVGGKSVGTPGVISALSKAHQQWGKLSWAQLFAPAIKTAEQGFAVSPRLHGLLKSNQQAGVGRFATARAYFYPNGQALPVGFIRKNQPYADLLKKIAKEGPAAFYQGDNANQLIATVNTASENPGRLTLKDLAEYQPVARDAVCAPYRQFKVCGMAPPSSGSLAVLQILGMLEGFNLSVLKPNSEQAVHLFSQASRLAFADRERFAADPAFSPVPVAGLLDPVYLNQRAKLIDPLKDQAVVVAGDPKGAVALASSTAIEFANTSHISIVDAAGNAVSMTTSIENAFGSGLMVNGYLLNNQLTDFSLDARLDGHWVANRVEAGKRPRSSMAPIFVFDAKQQLQIVAGSPGGSRIIDYVAQSIIAMIDWNMGPQQAANLPKITHRNDYLALEQNTDVAALAGKMADRGYQVKVGDLNSGLHLIKRQGNLWLGGVDPRREGLAAGQ